MAQINTLTADRFPACIKPSPGKIIDPMIAKHNFPEPDTPRRLPYRTSRFRSFDDYCEELESMYWRC